METGEAGEVAQYFLSMGTPNEVWIQPLNFPIQLLNENLHRIFGIPFGV